ncbi:dephospho-CoA kinase [Massilia sp. TS11]|uniref:dephospho-CoA kinase n=1 Tax=Massilia sp. TS11 TaxID=2908003 RepID=UPI001EDA5915|nr:dephospho-CoA kinase [Massilia sp. TS11]MCG2585299.1 dephospho-CoA kinase [Massilia sp. TS11]
MLRIGLTGGIGSGKSTVAALFAEHGASIVDADLIAHQLTGPDGAAMAAITAAFGPGYETPEGALDRAAMRRLVFADPSARHRLEAILHPLIRARAEAEAAAATGPYVMFVVPLLVESGGWRERVARILVVDCPEAVQVARVMARSGLARDQVEAIMASQASREQRRAAADDVVDNGGDPAALAPQIAQLHAAYLSISARIDANSPLRL